MRPPTAARRLSRSGTTSTCCRSRIRKKRRSSSIRIMTTATRNNANSGEAQKAPHLRGLFCLFCFLVIAGERPAALQRTVARHFIQDLFVERIGKLGQPALFGGGRVLHARKETDHLPQNPA